MTEEHAYAADPVSESEEALSELRDALDASGIALPSLGLDPVGHDWQPAAPLIALGCCTRDTARRLASALRARGAR